MSSDVREKIENDNKGTYDDIKEYYGKLRGFSSVLEYVNSGKRPSHNKLLGLSAEDGNAIADILRSDMNKDEKTKAILQIADGIESPEGDTEAYNYAFQIHR